MTQPLNDIASLGLNLIIPVTVKALFTLRLVLITSLSS